MKDEISDIQINYRDIPLFLALIPFINALNYYLTYSPIPFNTHTLLTFLIDTLEGYAAWLGLRFVILFLDKKMPYSPNPLKRIVAQVIASSAVALLIIVVLTEILNWMVKDTPVPRNFYTNDIFIFLIWFLVINGIYVALYYYQAMRHMEALRLEDKKIRTDGFFVRQGKQNLSIPFSEILGFYVDGEYSVLITPRLKKYFLDQSLDKIEQSLPEEIFFRLNRQYLVSRQALKGFSRLENGKLNILVEYPEYFPEAIQVSRIKAPSFKQWYLPE
jgi:DNA-binding LytR/AlgR family response regulator